jgi:hypothetical protein
MGLAQLAHSYLEAEGYDLTDHQRRLLVGHRRAVGGATELIHLLSFVGWVDGWAGGV